MDSVHSRQNHLNNSNADWTRSDFSDRYFSPNVNRNGQISRSMSDMRVERHPTPEESKYEKLSPTFPNGGVHPRHAVYDRNYSSASDTTVIEDNDETNPKRTLKNILSRFADRTSCVGPPYINSSNHFYSKFIWSMIFVGMVAATIVNVYLNVKTFNDRPVKTTVQIGYSSLTFPMVTICNSNAVRRSAVKLGSEDLQEFVTINNPEDFQRIPAPTEQNTGGQTPGQNTGGQTPGQNTGGQTTGQNTGGQTTGQNTGGQTTGQNTGGQTTGQNTGGQTTGQNTGGQTTDRNRGGSNTGPSRQKRVVDGYQQQQIAGNRTFHPPRRDLGDRLGGEANPLFDTQEEFSYLVAEENDTTRYKMGHQLDDMLISCAIEGRTCETGNFTSFLSDTYGVCYSFNQATVDIENLKQSYRRGNEYGLQLILFLEVDEFIPGITLGYGARVSISHPTAMPFPGSDGLFVSAGSEIDIGVKMINISRLSDPYGVCVDPQAFAATYGVGYTRQACQSICPNKLVLEICNCYEPTKSSSYYPINTTTNYDACNSTADYDCVSDVEYMYSIEGSLSCDCPSPCQETSYDLMISSREWPEDAYLHPLIDSICRRPGGEDSCQQMLNKERSHQRRNFLKLNVFYRDLNYETLQEELDYPESQFLSDLGGSIGLWVGLSVMSMAEVLELAGSLIVWLFRKCVRCEQQPKTRKLRENVQTGSQVSDSNGSKPTKLHKNVSHIPHQPAHLHRVDYSPHGSRL